MEAIQTLRVPLTSRTYRKNPPANKIVANGQGFVQYGKSRNESSALAQSQIEKQKMSFVRLPILHKTKCYGQYISQEL
jgi:outer membrane lipoprotein-sorting protein